MKREGRKLRAWMVERGISVSDVARRAGITRSIVSETIHGQRNMAPALMGEVHRISGGRMREALNVIAAIERIARLNALGTVDVADLEGAPLSFDWQSRTPKTVRPVAPGASRAACVAGGR